MSAEAPPSTSRVPNDQCQIQSVDPEPYRGVGDSVNALPFERSQASISLSGTHSRTFESWSTVILPTALSPRTSNQKSPQTEMAYSLLPGLDENPSR